MSAPTIRVGDIVRVTASGRVGRVMSRTLHPSSGRPRYLLAGAMDGRWYSRVELVRSHDLYEVHVQLVRSGSRLLVGDVVGARQALEVACKALEAAEHAERDTPTELQTARTRYAETLIRTPHPVEIPAMSEMKRHYEDTHPEEFGTALHEALETHDAAEMATEPRRIGETTCPVTPRFDGINKALERTLAHPAPELDAARPGPFSLEALQPFIDQINASLARQRAARAGFSGPVTLWRGLDAAVARRDDDVELDAAMRRHPAGSKVANDPADWTRAAPLGEDAWTRVGYLAIPAGMSVDWSVLAGSLPTPAQTLATALANDGVSFLDHLRFLAASHDGGRGKCVCEVCVLAALYEMAEEPHPFDMPDPLDDARDLATEMADKVQAVQDIVAKWSDGSTGPSSAMTTIHRIVNS